MANYSATTEVAALTPRYANGADYDATTRPLKTSVTLYLEQVSGIVDSMLATEGFTVPVTETASALAIDMFVSQEVASICEGINGSGRFGPSKKSTRGSRFAIILEDVQSFIKANATGFELMGAARPRTVASGIGARTTDASGDDTFPIFQREGFGNVFEDSDE